MRKALIVVVLTVLWLAPYWASQPVRPEPIRSITARAFGRDPGRASQFPHIEFV